MVVKMDLQHISYHIPHIFSYKRCEEWRTTNGQLHRDDGPARIIYDDKNNIEKEVWFYMGIQHRKGAPSKIEYENNVKRLEVWIENGFRHRIDGPAEISYYEDGKTIKFTNIFKHGKLHRKDGPAVLHYRKDGSSHIEQWHVNDQTHRTDGPAIYSIRKNGYIDKIKWYIHGIEKTNEINEWLKNNEFNIPINVNNWTDTNRMMFKLVWS